MSFVTKFEFDDIIFCTERAFYSLPNHTRIPLFLYRVLKSVRLFQPDLNIFSTFFFVFWALVPWSKSTSKKVTFWNLKACFKSAPPDLLIPGIKVRLKKAVRTLIPGIKKGVFRYVTWFLITFRKLNYRCDRCNRFSVVKKLLMS